MISSLGSGQLSKLNQTLMVIYGYLLVAPGLCGFATRCQIIGAMFANGHINYHLEHFDYFSFNSPYFIFLPKSFKGRCLW